jgi:hypothetical protein
MRNIVFAVSALAFYGCKTSGGAGGYPTSNPGGSTGSPPVTYTAPVSTQPPLACSGRPIGTYAWSQNYWRNGDSNLLDFLASDTGKQWACGDLRYFDFSTSIHLCSINIADYSNPDLIHDSGALVNFIQDYRNRVRNYDTVVWLTYGDVVEKAADKMLRFVNTFFAWAASIPPDVAVSMGRIGISFGMFSLDLLYSTYSDVEHIDPEASKNALLLSQDLRTRTNFPSGNLLIQHTIEGDSNVLGTHYVMLYSDSALAMVYRNYMHDPTGKYQDDSNILNRLLWMLTSQCQHCMDEAYVRSNYKAKITVMVEAACAMGNGCGKISMCAFDGADQGAFYTYNILEQMEAALVPDKISQSLKDLLFNSDTPYSVHNWEFFRCFAPFQQTFQYSSCANYHQLASDCRNQ